MPNLMQRIRKSTAGRKITDFLYSPYYIVAVGLCVLLCYSFRLDVLGFGLLTVACVCTLLLCEETTPLLPLILAFPIMPSMGIRENPKFYGTASIVFFVIYGVAIVASIAYHLIVFKGYKRLRFGGRLGIATVALGLGLFFSGFFCEYYPVDSMLWAWAQIGPLCVLFFFLRSTVRRDKNICTYFAVAALVMGLVICVQLAECYLFNQTFIQSGHAKDDMLLGWGISNHVGAAIAQSIPLTFYLACQEKKHPWLYYLLAVLMEICVVLTFSRAALLFSVPIFGVCVVVSCIKAENRKQMWIATAVLVFVGLVGFFVMRNKILSILSFYIENGFKDRGRFALWEKGLAFFASHPIFGVGQRYQALTYHPSYFFHNTPMQFLATGGLVGILTYAFYRVETVRLFMRKLTVHRAFLGLTLACIVLISLLDNGFVHIWSKGYTVFALLLAEHDLDRVDWFYSVPKLGKGKPLFVR